MTITKLHIFIFHKTIVLIDDDIFIKFKKLVIFIETHVL
jgi:hypothetical protein